MSDVDSAGGASEEEPVSTKQRAEEEEYNPEGECRVRKKRAPAKQREWIEYGRWDRDSFTQEDIDTKIGNIMNELNRDAGLTTIRGSHKDRTSNDHEEEEGIKFLTHKQKCLVAHAVKIAPMQTARQLLQNSD